jgi:radical SAM superfamily enzyme YgiQ (UPF0313 family)
MKKVYGSKYTIRERSVSNVIEELKLEKKRRGHYYLEILDNVFTLKPKRLDRFIEAYHKEIDLPFWCYSHPQCASESVIEPLSRYGHLGFIVMGIQSASENVGEKIFHRKHSADQVVEAARVLNKYNVRAFYDLITNVPGETEDDCRQNLNLLRRLPKPFRIRMTKISLFPDYDIRDITGETKFVTHERYRLWNAMYFLAQDVDLKDEEVDAILADETIRKHPEILEKLNAAYDAYDKKNYDLDVWYNIHTRLLEIKDKQLGELFCKRAELENELMDIKYRKGFRHFMRLSSFLQKLFGKSKSKGKETLPPPCPEQAPETAPGQCIDLPPSRPAD